MLVIDTFQSHTAARLLDFFGTSTPWHRRLWTNGLILNLQEILEASEAVRSGVLTPNNLKTLSSNTLSLMGADPGVGSAEQRKLLDKSLKTEIRFKGLEYRVIEGLTHNIAASYLTKWAAVLMGDKHPAPERTARAIASHLLDAGFSPEFLHRWWTYKINHEEGARPLSDLVRDAHDLLGGPKKKYAILVAFSSVPASGSGRPGHWLAAPDVSKWLKNNGFDAKRIRQAGGVELEIVARDPWSAVVTATEIVDTFSARVSVSSSEELKPIGNAWVRDQKKPFKLKSRRRGMEVRSLYREDRLYTDGQDAIVDAAFELLEPLASGSPGPAVAGGWAAIEALLAMPGDSQRGLAGDRLASIVAASFPRAELTVLAYKIIEAGGALGERIKVVETNRERSGLVAEAILQDEEISLTQQPDMAAKNRMTTLLSDPHSALQDIERHLQGVFRRFYKNRNLVLHWGRTTAVGLRPGLRTAAPLVGAGMDRIAHAWFVDGTGPHELAARAVTGLALVGTMGGVGPLDLLEPY